MVPKHFVLKDFILTSTNVGTGTGSSNDSSSDGGGGGDGGHECREQGCLFDLEVDISESNNLLNDSAILSNATALALVNR
jgi:hypothetical protein